MYLYQSIRTVLILTSAIFLLPNVTGAAERVMIEDVPHIKNSATPSQGKRIIELQEQWRIGGDDDETLLGLVTRVREDDSGNLFVMDAQLSQIHVYDPAGNKIRTLFREGEGPAEIRGPRDMVIMNDGRIGAVQEMPGKLIFVNKNGDPAGSLTIGGAANEQGGFCQTFAASAFKDLLVVTGFLQGQGTEPGHFTQTNFLSRADSEGSEIKRICETIHDLDFSNFSFDENKHLASYWWNNDIGPDGKVYVAPKLNRYEIHVFDADGKLERVIEREYEPWKRTAEEREYFTRVIRAVYYGVPFEFEIITSEYEPVVLYMHRGLRVHADGSIWVLTTHGVRDQAEGTMATFDVFSPEGDFTHQVEVRGPWDGEHDGLFFFADDHAVIVTGYADAMNAQFTGGNLTIDLTDDAASVEVIRCGISEK